MKLTFYINNRFQTIRGMERVFFSFSTQPIYIIGWNGGIMHIDIKVLPPTHLTVGETERLMKELVEVCYRKMESYNMTGLVGADIKF